MESYQKDLLEIRVFNRSENEAKAIKSVFYIGKNIRLNNYIKIMSHLVYSGLGT